MERQRAAALELLGDLYLQIVDLQRDNAAKDARIAELEAQVAASTEPE